MVWQTGTHVVLTLDGHPVPALIRRVQATSRMSLILSYRAGFPWLSTLAVFQEPDGWRTAEGLPASLEPNPHGTDRDHCSLDADLPLGSCGACSGPGARYLILLTFKAPIPGHGWGCRICGLPDDGATAVVCDRCLEVGRPVVSACRGYPATEGRIAFDRLTGHQAHDPRRHAHQPAVW